MNISLAGSSRLQKFHILVVIALLTLVPAACSEPTTPVISANTPAATPAACAVEQVAVLAEDAFGPSWIPWESDCLPNADLAYVARDTWDVWVMDEQGRNRRCLTCYEANIFGTNFPLDEDDSGPEIHWKGDPQAHPSQPLILFKSDNEHSSQRLIRNSPSIGWDNDAWALNVCTGRYTRLTQQPAGMGLQHTALSDDGLWYVYPQRYARGNPPWNFGLARMSFNELSVDSDGNPALVERFAIEPDGQMYYEPIDIRQRGPGAYTLLYVAGTGNRMDPYRYDWRCNADGCTGASTRLLDTPDLHEEFTMYAPAGDKIIYMQGPLEGLGYHTELFLASPAFEQPQQLTHYNDCDTWPDRCTPAGSQFSRLDWHPDGTAVFYGLWIHAGPLRPATSVELHRLDLTPACTAPD